MTISEMLGQSGILTLLGIGVVFAFLVILILAMHLLHAIVSGLKLDTDEKKTTNSSTVAKPVTAVVQNNNEAVIAAIAAAIKVKQ